MHPNDVSHRQYCGTGADADAGRAAKQNTLSLVATLVYNTPIFPILYKGSLLYRWIVSRAHSSYPIQLLSSQLLYDLIHSKTPVESTSGS